MSFLFLDKISLEIPRLIVARDDLQTATPVRPSETPQTSTEDSFEGRDDLERTEPIVRLVKVWLAKSWVDIGMHVTVAQPNLTLQFFLS